MKSIFTLLSAFVFFHYINAQPGALDPTFGNSGKVTTSFGPSSRDEAHAMAVQNDGKVVLAGFTLTVGGGIDFALARYNTNGSLDVSFDGDGKVTTVWGPPYSYFANAIALQSDGKIIVAGYRQIGSTSNTVLYDFAMVRFNTDGSLDLTFDGDGKVITTFGSFDAANAIAIQKDGKIVVAGNCKTSSLTYGVAYTFALARYNANGSLDLSFDGDGKVTTEIGFSGSVYAPPSGITAVAIQDDGKIVAAGSCDNAIFNGNNDFALTRYNPDGSLDVSFNDNGMVITGIGSLDWASGIGIQSDGKIVVSGHSLITDPTTGSSNYDFSLARFNVNGSLDSSFDGDGKVITKIWEFGDDYATDMVLQSNGKIIVAGYSRTPGSNYDFVLVRYNTSGSLDFSFDGDGKVITAIGVNDDAYAINLYSNRIYVAGTSYNGINLDFALVAYQNLMESLSSSCITSLRIYPNPVKDKLHIQVQCNGNATLQILDVAGRVVHKQKIQYQYNASNTIDVSYLPKGAYFLVLLYENESKTQKFLRL